MNEPNKYTLKELRARHNLTQDDMAKALNLTRQSYINIEKNPERATVDRMMQIARILKVSIGEIFFEQIPNK